MTDWTHDWPTKPGWYWFYGDPHGNRYKDQFVRLYPVRVGKISNGLSYVAEGNFTFKSQASDGVWTKMIVPSEPPEEDA